MRFALGLLVVGFAVVAACGASSEESGAPLPSASDAGTPSRADASVATTSDAAGVRDSSSSGCVLSKPYSTKDTDCNTCAEASCCIPINDCYAAADCDDGYVNCLLACLLLPDDAGPDAADSGAPSCTAACGTQYPAGKSKYDALSSCVDTKCTAECQ